jgi:hypothetical protein
MISSRKNLQTPTGTKGEKRLADVIGNAVKVMRVLTSEEPEDYGEKPAKDQAAVETGLKGGKKERRGHDGGTARGDRQEGGG